MLDFDEVKTKLNSVSVTAPDHKEAHGVLSLDGMDSAIELNSKSPIGEFQPPGWFDIRLIAAHGKSIFVHNALQTSGSHTLGSENWNTIIFPNKVVDDAKSLDECGKCRVISFRLDGFDSFFNYNYIDNFRIYKNFNEDFYKYLGQEALDFNKYKQFDPDEIFVINKSKKILEFEACNRIYSINSIIRPVSRNSVNVNFKIYIKAKIVFPELVDLDTAIEACWHWRCYFNQLAMRTVIFLGMSVSASTDLKYPTGNLYLPYEQPTKSQNSSWQADAYRVPLNQWEDRERASEAMRLWLEQQQVRKVFRASLDRVLSRSGRVLVEDAVALCAGIDTLPELKTREELSKNVLTAMASAAVVAAKSEGQDFSLERVKNLLGQLQNDSLKTKLMRLAEMAAPEVANDKLNSWIDLVLPLRTLGAHGRSPAMDHELISGHVVDGLAALCARFDLQTAGVPERCANGAENNPTLRWNQALNGIDMHNQALSMQQPL